MKKILSIILAAALVCGIAAMSVTTSFADAVYIVNGYSYNIINNRTIAICGWDNSTPEFVVPEHIGGRHVAAIADYGLEYNDVITSVDFSQAAQLKEIGIESFIECTGIASEVTIPETVTKIGERAFQGCNSMPSVVIKANVTSIPKQCFYQCSALESVVLPDTLTEISGFAFADCTALTYVEIPSSVTSIAASSFRNDPNLTLGVHYDSYAYHYAKDNNIAYALVENVMLGETNGDGGVDINDATQIQRHLAQFESLEGIYLYAADANGDGVVDIDDATAIQLYLAQYEIPYHIGEVITQ